MAADPKRSIKPWIPLTSQTDPDKFPMYEYRPYPRMMTKLCTQADLDIWLAENSYTADNGKIAYKGGRPRVGTSTAVLNESGQAVIVNSAEEEAEFLKSYKQTEKTVLVEVPAQTNTLEQIAKTEQEISDLKVQIAEQPKRRGRPPKSVDLPPNLPPAS